MQRFTHPETLGLLNLLKSRSKGLTLEEIKAINPAYIEDPLDELEETGEIESVYVKRGPDFAYVYRIRTTTFVYDASWVTFRDNCKKRQITLSPIIYHCLENNSICQSRDTCPRKDEVSK